MKPTAHIFIKTALFCACYGFANALFGQMPPNLKVVLPLYGANKIELEWDHVPLATSYEFRRKVNAGSYGAWTPTSSLTSHTDDVPANTFDLYTYQVRAQVNGNWTNPSTERSNSFQKTWPVANGNSCGSSSGSGVLNGFNQPILAAGSHYLHEGMDINGDPTFRSECVVAPMGGVVIAKGGNGNNTAVNLKVFLNGQSEYLQLNHLGGLLSNYKVGESVMPGQQLGFIMGDTSGWTVLSSHTHFHYWRNNALFWASTSDPHSVFDAPAHKDPFQESPKVEDTNGDNKPLRFRHGPDKTTYFDGDSFFDDDDEIYQETDIVVEVVDRQSSNPPYAAPKQLGYFIEKLDGATWKNAVRNASKPYLLTDNIFGFYQAASGLPANPNLPVTNAMSDRNPSLKSSAPATPSDYDWTQWWTYQVTNTTGTDGDPGNLDANQCWATDARNNVGTPNGYQANYDRARINDEAKFPDGKYRVNIRMADWVNTSSDYQKEIFVNNFRPYVKQFDMEQVGVGAYSCAWDFDAGTGNLSPTVYETDEGAKFSRCKDIKMKITMSEPMKYVSIHFPGITTFSQPCTAVFGSNSKKWEFTIPKDWLEKLSSNIYNIEIEGKDKSDEDIQGFSDNLTPVSSANIPKHQQGNTWLPNIPAQKDKAHSFEITGEKVAAFALGGGIFTLCNSNPKVTLYSGASGGTEPYNFNWKGAGNSVEVSASGKYTATVEDKNGCKAEASVYVIVIPVVCGGSGDPNQILGPSGFDMPRWVSKNDVLAYHVDFENDPAIANAPAQRILVEVPYDPDFQLNTFKVGRFGFANLEFEVPENRTFYQTRVDATSTTGVLVDVSAGIDIVNQKLFWIFQAVDPATGLPPTDAFMGLLPVNDTLTNNGQGFVEFTIKPGPATQTGDTVTAQASIFFDQNEVVPTNVWSNLIDALPPTSTLDALAPTQYSTFFPISFSGEDDSGGSGLDFFELFVSENGGSFERYGDRTSETINFIGNIGSRYEFFTLATDRTGNREATKTSGDTVHIEGMTATVVTQNPDCPGAASGSATINRTGGKAPFHYAWSAAGAGNTDTVSGLAPGIYTASVSDSNFPPLLVELEFEISDTIELTPPTTLCQNLTQNLQASDTLAHFSALSIADGSADNCGAVMISPSTFDFGCGELGPHTVTLTVTDISGNTATCSATLTVTDANGLCNPDADGDGYPLSNDCDDGNAAIHPGIAENCGLVGIPGVDDDCDGTIDEDLTPPTITCPASQALKTGDDGGADCEVIVTYTTPTFADNCEGTGAATYVSGPASGTSLNVSGSPYTVVYTKTDAAGNAVLTDCSFTVTVQDDTKPTLANCPSNILLKTGDDGGADCEVTVTYAAPTFSDNCDGTGTATWVSGPTSGTSLNVSGSPYTVVYTKTDAAGNTVATNCSFTVTVQDDTKPTLAGCPSSNTFTPLSGNFTYTLSGTAYDPTGLSDNCGVAGVSNDFNNMATLNGAVLPTGANLIEWTVTDVNGLINTCQFTLTVTAFVEISGTIFWKGDGVAGVNNANVALSGEATHTDVTDTNGDFDLVTNTGDDFIITPSKNTGMLNGVTTADATVIQRHLTGSELITDFYRLIAADCNRSNNISSVDAALIRQALLGSPSALNILNAAGHWRFVRTDYVPVLAGPYTLDHHALYNKRVLTGVSGMQPAQDFYGVKAGDVFEESNPGVDVADPSLKPDPDAKPLVWRVRDRLLKAGQTIELDFSVVNFADIAAYQYGMRFDPAVLQYQQASGTSTLVPLDEASHFGTWQVAKGELRTLWSVSEGKTLSGVQPMYRLRFKVLQGGKKLSEVLGLDPAILAALAYTSHLAQREVQLVFTVYVQPGLNQPDVLAGDYFDLLQNRPNPFSERTTIGFILPVACDAQLRVLDISGRELWRLDKSYPAGYHEETVRLDEIGATGMLFYELTTPQGKQTRKMMAVRL